MGGKTRKIKRTQLDKFIDGLKELPEKKKTVLTARQAVVEAYPHLSSLLEKGYSYDDLVSLLDKSGIRIKRGTLQQYFRAAKKEHDNSEPESDNVSADKSSLEKTAGSNRSVINTAPGSSSDFLEMDEDL
ncbi:MAG: hypothetical protein AAFY76_16600 [Cyanobacteria bacterium J06649_11]